jgi:hypothetical protein
MSQDDPRIFSPMPDGDPPPGGTAALVGRRTPTQRRRRRGQRAPVAGQPARARPLAAAARRHETVRRFLDKDADLDD